MELDPLPIAGCFIVLAPAFEDERGGFVKSFHVDTFERLGLRTDWREDYFTTSRLGVVRGMHFQVPPAEHAKLVFCVAGEVLDVVLDIRAGSSTYGKACGVSLSPESGRGVYIPEGCAHGFLSRSENSVMYYKVTSVHSPAEDSGIAWDSFDFDWPVQTPILSPRDAAHPRLTDFASPFSMTNARCLPH